MSGVFLNKHSKGGNRAVNQYTLDDKFVKTWDSAKDAGKAMAGSRNRGQGITKACVGKLLTYYNFKWEYVSIDDINGEKWLQIPNMPGFYASTNGRVKKRHKDNERLLKGTVCGQYNSMRIQNQIYPLQVLICSTFNGIKPSEKHEVNHINGNSLDNRASNLEWTTHQENMKHALDTGLIDVKKIGLSNQRKVNKYSITGEFICEYPSITIAGETEKMNTNHISSVCRGKPNHATSGGFIWKYANLKIKE